MTRKKTLQKIQCPQCGKANTWSHDNPYRPFCSDRCRLIDLGDWVEEKNRVPGESIEPSQPSDEEDSD